MDTIDGPFDPFAMTKSESRDEASPTQDFKPPSITSSTDSFSSGEQQYQVARFAKHTTTVNPPVHYRNNFTAKGYIPPATHASPARLPPPVSYKAIDWNDDGIPFDEKPNLPNLVIKPMALPWDTGDFHRDNDIPAVTPKGAYSDVEYGTAPEKPKTRAYFSETDDSVAYLAPPKTKRVTVGPPPVPPPVPPQPRQSSPRKPPLDDASHDFPLDESPTKSSRMHSGKDDEEDNIHHDESFHASECEPHFEHDYRPHPKLKAKQDYEEFGLSPGSVTEDGSKSRAVELPVLKPNTNDPSFDDDSLFDFGDESPRNRVPTPVSVSDKLDGLSDAKKNAVMASNQRRGRRGKRHSNVPTEDSDADTSLDADYGVIRQRSSSLQARAQEAFKTRPPRVKERAQSNPKKRTTSATSPIVHFDQNNNTVHRFARFEADEEGALYTHKTDQLESEAEYIKSVESEVEDAIKDLLFIGSGSTSIPGRRRTPQAERPRGTFFADDSTINDSITLNTLEESTLDGTTFTNFSKDSTSTSCNHSPTKREITPRKTKKMELDEDPLVAIWEIVEGSMNAVGAALGLAASPEPEKDDDSPASRDVGRENPTPEILPAKEKSSFDLFEVVSQSASDLFLNATGSPTNAESTNSMSPAKSRDGVKSLEDDSRLADFALHTARSVHTFHGMVFDEKANPDVITHMQFVYVNLGLPLGILFQENSGGCWVVKIFPNGNAASADVKVGDQLGAINGNSSIKMTVDDICKAVSEANDPKSIDLTFLRYIGPLLPTAERDAADEGCEHEMSVVEEGDEEEECYPLEKMRSFPDDEVMMPTPRSPRKVEVNKSPKAAQKEKKPMAQAPILDLADEKQKRGLGRFFIRKKK